MLTVYKNRPTGPSSAGIQTQSQQQSYTHPQQHSMEAAGQQTSSHHKHSSSASSSSFASYSSQSQQRQASTSGPYSQHPTPHVSPHPSLVNLPAAPPSPFTFPDQLPGSNIASPPGTASDTTFPSNSSHSPSPHASPNMGSSSLQLGLNIGQSHTLSRQASPHPQGQMQGQRLGVPQSPTGFRMRSKSDSAQVRPPFWQLGLDAGGQQQGDMNVQQQMDDASLGRMNVDAMQDFGMGIGASGMYGQQQQQQQRNQPQASAPPMSHGYTYGPPLNNNMNPNANPNNAFLSPTSLSGFGPGAGIGGTDLRRAKSESSGHRRGVRSEDIGRSGGAFNLGMGLGEGNQGNNVLLVPPSPHLHGQYLSANQDYLDSLSIGRPLSSASMSSTTSLGGGGVGLHRRSNSGSVVSISGRRSLSRERGAMGLGSNPYPSPHASPRVRPGDLNDMGGVGGVSVTISDGMGGVSTSVQPIPGGGLANSSPASSSAAAAAARMGRHGHSQSLGMPMHGMHSMDANGGGNMDMSMMNAGMGHQQQLQGGLGMNFDMGGMGAMNMNMNAMGMGMGMGMGMNVIGGNGGGDPGAGGVDVSRPTVTSPATEQASRRRRTTDANFICPVPGCGSTFTRHFNLKGALFSSNTFVPYLTILLFIFHLGHLRSHQDQRPFKCKWPGCDKGFARQHDCKRHEQLHLNIRPYVCKGCDKMFARMDALNRHLRSDAGTDCQARQPILTTDQPNNPAMANLASINGLKAEQQESMWPPQTGGVMV